MSTLEERVLAIEQHLGLNVVNAVFTEPTDPGAVVTYYDVELDRVVEITRDEHGAWAHDHGWRRGWSYWVNDARPGTIRRVG